MIQNLIQQGFIKSVKTNGDIFFILSTPCRIRVTLKEVAKLKTNYLDNEEIGGVMIAKPTKLNGENVLVVYEVKIIRNAIEDKPLYDKKTCKLLRKSNAYLLDYNQFYSERKKIFESGYLPIRFHTHPTKGTDIFDSIRLQQLQTDASEQDQEESKTYDPIENQKLLMPRGLIVGNKDFCNDLFIGVYGGFIAPLGFDESKMKVQQEHIKNFGSKISSKVESLNLSDNEKILYGVGAVMILGFIVYKTRKFSIPVILGLATVAPLFLTNTGNIENPNYFNKLSFGDTDIYIPREDGEFYPK